MKNKSTLTFYTLLFVCCISLVFTNNAVAQENGIYELSNSDFSKSVTKSEADSGRSEFNKLAYNLHPTIYIQNGITKTTYGQGLPVKLTLKDIKSISVLNSGNPKYNQVQLITIKLSNSSDLNTILDLSNASGLSELKYIFIKCHFKCTADQIKTFVKATPQTRIFYTSETPS